MDSAVEEKIPLAFLSYARNDNREGRVAEFHQKLNNELRTQLGDKSANIFMDADIELGVPWRERISVGLAKATFLLPIVTPSFLASKECREELDEFIQHERRVERGDLILPIVYINCDEFLTSTNDELVDSTWKTLRTRQFFDWSPFRHKDFSNEVVREALANLARQIHGRMNQLTSESSRETATRRSGEVPIQLTLRSLFSRDPVAGWPAAEEIAQRGEEAVGPVIDGLRGNAEQTNFILRDLLGRLPEASAPGLLGRIEMAASNWHLASEIPEILSPAHAPFCEARLAALVHAPNMDVQRVAIEALGYLGSADRAPTIFDLLEKASADGYRYEKIYRYGMEALARIVVSAPMEPAYGGSARLAFEELEAALKLPLPEGRSTVAAAGLQKVLGGSKPHHGDRFIKVWLASPVQEIRQLGAYALGGIGAGWAVPSLSKKAADPAEAPQVKQAAALALGAIGGQDAYLALDALELDEDLGDRLWSAYSMNLEDVPEDSRFRTLVRALIDHAPSEVCLVYRAIGRRGDRDLIDLVRRGLSAEDGSIRGDAALALARLDGADAATALHRSFAAAGSTREKLLASLALLAIGEELPGDPELMELRRLLADESFLYWSVTQNDIIETLRDSPHPASLEIAEAWKPLYEATSAY